MIGGEGGGVGSIGGYMLNGGDGASMRAAGVKGKEIRVIKDNQVDPRRPERGNSLRPGGRESFDQRK